MDYKEYAQKNNIDLSKPDLAFELGNLISEARMFAGISQADLAKRMSTTQSSVSRAENGDVEPSLDFLERVAKAVGTTLVYPKFAFMLELQGNNTAYISAGVDLESHYAQSHMSQTQNGLRSVSKLQTLQCTN
jgi:transcriptional regulator with XRE-family HTH domain